MMFYFRINCCKVFRKLSMIEQPNVGFNFTSIGSVDSLKKYITNYIHLPGTSHYWSKDTLDPKKTKWLRPGMLDDSQEEMRDLYEYIAKVTKIPVTISWVLIRGFNDQPEDVRMIADFFRGRPFEIKLMALVKGSLSGFKDTTAGDLQRFKKQLDEVGVPARIRAIWGTKIHAQCGGTIIPWLRNKQYDFQPFYDEV